MLCKFQLSKARKFECHNKTNQVSRIISFNFWLVYLILVGCVQYVYFGWDGVVGVNQYCCNRKIPKGKVQFPHNRIFFVRICDHHLCGSIYIFLALMCVFCSFGM
jgi:hypothetical protein